MAAAAVRLASQLFEDLGSEIKVLFVGAGEMIELAPRTSPPRTPRPSPLPTARWSAARSWPPALAAR
jgi:hypothetical protein